MIPRRNIKLYKKGLFLYLILWLKERHKENYFLKFREELKKYFENEDIFLLGGGRQALHLIFDSVDFEKGSEIIIPNYYLKTLIPLIKSKGLVPVFCDINRENLSLDLQDTLSMINKDTKFIILCHMFGICQNAEEFIRRVKQKKEDILIIEDCAHAFGSEFNNRKLGALGDFSFFSFNYIKTITTLEGGSLIVNNKNYLADMIKNYKNYKFPARAEILKKVISYYLLIILFKTPFLHFLKYSLRKQKLREIIKKIYHSYKDNHKKQRLSPFLAFLGYRQLLLFEEKQTKIASLLEEYQRKLRPEIWNKRFVGYNSKCSNYYFTVLTDNDSKNIERQLSKRGVDIGINDEVMDLCKNDHRLKNSRAVFERIMQIPLYHALSEKKVEKIARALNKAI